MAKDTEARGGPTTTTMERRTCTHAIRVPSTSDNTKMKTSIKWSKPMRGLAMVKFPMTSLSRNLNHPTSTMAMGPDTRNDSIKVNQPITREPTIKELTIKESIIRELITIRCRIKGELPTMGDTSTKAATVMPGLTRKG